MKIALIGYGKMGKEIEKIAQSRGHEIVARIDPFKGEDFTSPGLKNAQVAIEFSTPETAYSNYLECFKINLPVVSGTTGWLKHLDEIKDWCRINYNKDSRKYYRSVNEISTLVAKKRKIEIRINQFRLRYWYWKK